MTRIRLALLLLIVGICLPARIGAWLVGGAESGSSQQQSECRGAPADDDDAAGPTGAVVESDDDDDDWDGEDGFIPVGSLPLDAPRRSTMAVLHVVAMTAPGVSSSLFRPPRAIA